jgi:DNA polymerase-3 subunit beta
VPKRLAALIKELTGDVVKFNLGNKLSVTCGAAKSTLPTLDVDDFPTSNFVSGDPISVNAAALRNALDIAQTSAATKGASPTILKGVCLSFKGNVLTAVGADGIRASLSTVPILDSIADKIELTIPVTSVKSLIAALKDKEHASIGFGRDASWQINKIVINCDDSVRVTSQSFNGRFPDWSMLIPTQMASVVSVNPDDLEKALKIVKVTADKNDHIVFQFSDAKNELHLSSDMGQGVDGEVAIKAELVSYPNSGEFGYGTRCRWRGSD